MNQTSFERALFLQRRKQRFGFWYGITAGAAFAIMLWGLDGLRLAQAFAYYPWLKLAAGMPLVMLIDGLAGWLTSRFERPLLGVLLWVAASGALAWLTILVPIVFFPALAGWLNPELDGLIRYTFYDNASVLASTAFGWVVIAAFITAVIQVPMIEQAAFSTSVFGKIAPNLIAAFLMLVSGTVADTLTNQPLRDSLLSMNNTIQYSLETKGSQPDSKTARELHLAALRPAQNVISEDYRLVVSWYDPLLENVNILIRFDRYWVECGTIFTHPLNCRVLPP